MEEAILTITINIEPWNIFKLYQICKKIKRQKLVVEEPNMYMVHLRVVDEGSGVKKSKKGHTRKSGPGSYPPLNRPLKAYQSHWMGGVGGYIGKNMKINNNKKTKIFFLKRHYIIHYIGTREREREKNKESERERERTQNGEACLQERETASSNYSSSVYDCFYKSSVALLDSYTPLSSSSLSMFYIYIFFIISLNLWSC